MNQDDVISLLLILACIILLLLLVGCANQTSSSHIHGHGSQQAPPMPEAKVMSAILPVIKSITNNLLLSWDAPTNGIGVLSYRVFIATNDPSLIGEVPYASSLTGTNFRFTISYPWRNRPFIKLCFAVTASDDGGTSDLSNIVNWPPDPKLVIGWLIKWLPATSSITLYQSPDPAGPWSEIGVYGLESEFGSGSGFTTASAVLTNSQFRSANQLFFRGQTDQTPVSLSIQPVYDP